MIIGLRVSLWRLNPSGLYLNLTHNDMHMHSMDHSQMDVGHDSIRNLPSASSNTRARPIAITKPSYYACSVTLSITLHQHNIIQYSSQIKQYPHVKELQQDQYDQEQCMGFEHYSWLFHTKASLSSTLHDKFTRYVPY